MDNNHTSGFSEDFLLLMFRCLLYSLNWKDLQATTLVGLTRQNPEPDPLALQHLNNPLYIDSSRGVDS